MNVNQNHQRIKSFKNVSIEHWLILTHNRNIPINDEKRETKIIIVFINGTG